MDSTRLERLAPARQFVVSGPADVALATAVASLLAEKFVQRSAPGALPVVFEYGSVAAGILGLGAGFLPGRLGNHGWTVVDSAPGATGTTITIAHITGMVVVHSARRAIERTQAAFEGAGVLLDAGEPMSSHDLPATSPGNPETFRASGFVTGPGRWVVS